MHKHQIPRSGSEWEVNHTSRVSWIEFSFLRIIETSFLLLLDFAEIGAFSNWIRPLAHLSVLVHDIADIPSTDNLLDELQDSSSEDHSGRNPVSDEVNHIDPLLDSLEFFELEDLFVLLDGGLVVGVGLLHDGDQPIDPDVSRNVLFLVFDVVDGVDLENLHNEVLDVLEAHLHSHSLLHRLGIDVLADELDLLRLIQVVKLVLVEQLDGLFGLFSLQKREHCLHSHQKILLEKFFEFENIVSFLVKHLKVVGQDRSLVVNALKVDVITSVKIAIFVIFFQQRRMVLLEPDWVLDVVLEELYVRLTPLSQEFEDAEVDLPLDDWVLFLDPRGHRPEIDPLYLVQGLHLVELLLEVLVVEQIYESFVEFKILQILKKLVVDLQRDGLDELLGVVDVHLLHVFEQKLLDQP